MFVTKYYRKLSEKHLKNLNVMYWGTFLIGLLGLFVIVDNPITFTLMGFTMFTIIEIMVIQEIRIVRELKE